MTSLTQQSLQTKHCSEIIDQSAVDPQIAALNFWTIIDPSEADKLLNRNSKQRWKHSDNLIPAWAVTGLDPKTEERWLRGVQIKPDQPILNADGKPQKYLSASGYETAPLFLNNGQSGYWPNVLSDRFIPILLTEGAKKAACLLSLGYAAVSLPGVWNGQVKGRLRESIHQFSGLGRKVYLAFDSDQLVKPQVQQALDRLGRLLIADGCVVFVITWNQSYKGIDDFCVGAGSDAVHHAIKEALTFEEWRDTVQPEAKTPKKTAADSLLGLAQKATYFHTADKVAYADIWIDGNRHTYAVRSKNFRLWLTGEYFNEHGKGISAQTMQDTLNTLEAIAIFRGQCHEVHLRLAEYQEKIYLDLGTPDWKAVEVSATGWQIVPAPPVRFWRPDTLQALPYPEQGGSLDELKSLLNVDGKAWTLISTFLLFSFCPNKTYPVLVLSAPRGSGKTAAAEILKSVLDPGKAPLIKPQNDTHKLAVTASRRWLMAYDNISHISAETSDDFCRLSTGFGYSTRTLHTTDEETTFEFARPQVITAIDALVTRDDLADRVLMVQLPIITEENRLEQSALNQKLASARPRILGALLTALSQTLKALPETKPDKLPRLADYARFAIAAETALNFSPGEFKSTFDESREESRQIVIESSPIGEAIMALMRDRSVWKGTASELLNDLERFTEESTVKSRYWPKASNVFKRQLNRLAPDLKALGLELQEIREGHDRTRKLVLEKQVKISSASSADNHKSLKLNQRELFAADDNADDMRTIPETVDDRVRNTSNDRQFLKVSLEELSNEINSTKTSADDTLFADDRKSPSFIQSSVASQNGNSTKTSADDTLSADDMRTIEKNGIVRTKNLVQQAIQDNADDADDKLISHSKWMRWKKIDTQVEVLESKGNQSQIRIPGQRKLEWVHNSELVEVGDALGS